MLGMMVKRRGKLNRQFRMQSEMKIVCEMKKHEIYEFYNLMKWKYIHFDCSSHRRMIVQLAKSFPSNQNKNKNFRFRRNIKTTTIFILRISIRNVYIRAIMKNVLLNSTREIAQKNQIIR
jgi:hypothetical protein